MSNYSSEALMSIGVFLTEHYGTLVAYRCRAGMHAPPGSVREMRGERMFKLHNALLAFSLISFGSACLLRNRTKPLFCPLLAQGGKL